MTTATITLPERDLDLFTHYAEVNGVSLSEAIRSAMLERIEDEYDLEVFAEYEREKAAGGGKTYSHEEVWKDLGA